jgi:hypothetical protein
MEKSSQPSGFEKMLCKAEGCQKPVRSRGMCGAHYQLWKRFGDLFPRAASNHAGAEFISRAIQYRGDDCLLWPYGKNAGYGSVQLDGHSQRAHRIVCEAVYGPPPFSNADAAHACGMRACCNPSHLRWDTRKGNMADGLIHGTRRLGERVPIAKLTAADVIAIRSQPNRTQVDLAQEYSVSESNICMIRNRKRWKHIP